jgi:hypothetical protein
MRRHLLMYDQELEQARERISYFAAAIGYQLAAVFVEEVDTWPVPVAFERLLQAVALDKVEVVILPSMLHFMVLGGPTRIREYFESATGAKVVCINDVMSHSPGEAVS